MTTVINFKKYIALDQDEIAVIASNLEDMGTLIGAISSFLSYKVCRDKSTPLAVAYKKCAQPLINKIEEYKNEINN